MQWLKDFINTIWTTLQAVLGWLLDGIISILQFILFAVFDGFLTVIETLLTALDFSSLMFTGVAQWSSMPTQLIWLINHLALPQGLSMIGSALIIRKLLDLFLGYFTDV
jgi:hypothetical protein